MRRFVIDTRIVVNGLTSPDPHSAHVGVLQRMLTGDFTFVLSPGLIRHYTDTLNRPTLSDSHGLQRSQVDALVARLAANAVIRDPERRSHGVGDPGDQLLIDLVLSDSELVLVTGDFRLHRSQPGIEIVSPAGLLQVLTARRKGGSSS